MNESSPAGNSLQLADLIAIAWRHKFKFLLVFGGIMAFVIYLALSLPASYRSSVTLLVEAQELPESAVESSIGGYVEARLAAIEKRILSTTVLTQMAKEVGILPATVADEVARAYVAEMRFRIARETTVIEAPSPRGPSSTVSFAVYYEDPYPQNAQLVANALAQLYISENSALRIGLAQGVNEFLDSESERLIEQLSGVESRLADFKRENFAKLPENLNSNLLNIDKADMNMQSLQSQIQELESKRLDLVKQLRLNERAEGAALVRQVLMEKKAELRQLRLRYQDAHPDIADAVASINELEQLLADGTADSYQAPSETATPTDNNLLITLKSQLAQVDSALSLARSQMEDWAERREDYEQRLAQSPEVEQEYEVLLRERANINEALSQMENKQMRARLSLRLEKDQKAERFVVVEPAALPTAPYKPNRPALALLGFVFALFSGVVVVAIAERYSSTVNGVRGVIGVLGEAPLATIPVISK